MINYYEELNIKRSWKLSEIQNYINKNFQKWEGLALSRGDSQSMQLLDYAKKAQQVFKNQQNRKKYDYELELFLNPPTKINTRLKLCKENFDKAKVAYQRNDWDMAYIAIQSCLNDRENGNVSPLRLAAAISSRLKNFSEALGYINKAILEKPEDNRNYYLKLDILVQECVNLSKSFYKNDQELEKKEEVFNYLSNYFELDVSPITNQDFIQLYEEQLKQNRLLNSQHMLSFRDEIFHKYKKIALEVNDSKLYIKIYNAYKKYFYDGYDYETSLELFSFSKKVLRISPQEKVAIDFVNCYEEIRKNEEIYQKESLKRKREATELKANIGKEINTLNKQIKKCRSELSEVRHERFDTRLLECWTIKIGDIGGLFAIYVICGVFWFVFFLYTTQELPGSKVFVLPIIIHMAIEIVIWLINSVRKEKISTLETKISKIEREIESYELERDRLMQQFRNLSNIPYNGESIY